VWTQEKLQQNSYDVIAPYSGTRMIGSSFDLGCKGHGSHARVAGGGACGGRLARWSPQGVVDGESIVARRASSTKPRPCSQPIRMIPLRKKEFACSALRRFVDRPIGFGWRVNFGNNMLRDEPRVTPFFVPARRVIDVTAARSDEEILT